MTLRVAASCRGGSRPMRSLETIVIDHVLHEKLIDVLHGDLTDLPPGSRFDILVVSAFPGDYTPTDGSLIGALDRAGLSVEALAQDKAYDLRETFSCWLSHPIPASLGLGFDRVLCFEPSAPGRSAVERVDDIFRALAPFIGLPERPVTSVAMPVITAGDMGSPVRDVAEPLIRAASHWMRTSPLNRVAIVAHGEPTATELQAEAARVRAALIAEQTAAQKDYDVFLSYSHADREVADHVVTMLRRLQPDLRIFRDTAELRAGHDYRVQLDRAVRGSRRFLPLLTPAYVTSIACQDEFNAAWSIRQRHDPDFFFPLFVYGTELTDPRMSYLHYEDCTDADLAKIDAACGRLVERLVRPRVPAG
jgi:O-acetyl-ADP-ribose deacetylase (regulator of RNase III)